jgi:nucleoid-associated protein YgaU
VRRPRIGPAVTVALTVATVGLASAALLVSMPAPARHVVHRHHVVVVPQCTYSAPGTPPAYGPCTGGPPVVRRPPPLTHRQLAQSAGYYVVKAGDSLWSISHSSLTHPRRWLKLWKLNPKITDPSQIYPGEVLKL